MSYLDEECTFPHMLADWGLVFLWSCALQLDFHRIFYHLHKLVLSYISQFLFII